MGSNGNHQPRDLVAKSLNSLNTYSQSTQNRSHNQGLVVPSDFNQSNTGPTAVSREASSPLQNSQQQSYKATALVHRPDPFDQTVQMSDADFDAGLMHAAQNVHQNKDNQDTNRSKRVRINTKRYIAEY